jgi:hypothetical protein
MKSFEEWLSSQQFSPSNSTELDALKRAYDAMCATAEADKIETVKGGLSDRATQYYVAGRLAARAGLLPVYGNLLHHAVEMFLKTALVGVVTLKEIKDKFSHNLQKLWTAFKEKEGHPSLDRFDATIQALHEFEELRYPDTIPHPAIMVAITWKPEHAVKSSGTAAAHHYEFFISEVDGIIIEILDRIPLNPKYLVGKVGNIGSSGREALRYQNAYAARWGLDPKNHETFD